MTPKTTARKPGSRTWAIAASDAAPCESASTSETIAPVKKTAPVRSSGERFALALEDGSRRKALSSTSKPTGTLTKKTQRQESTLVSTPPRITPAAKPRPEPDPQPQTARLRSGPSGKVVVSNASAVGDTM